MESTKAIPAGRKAIVPIGKITNTIPKTPKKIEIVINIFLIKKVLNS